MKSIEEYEHVVIGGSLRAGTWLGDAQKLAKRTIKARKPHTIFICCLFATTKEGRETLQREVLPRLKEKLPGLNLDDLGIFPGARNMDEYNFLVRKLIISIARKAGDDSPDEPQGLPRLR